ncbi:DUF418 domain-containing protein [Terrihalobacillus insolitus]|uniref:DUF418 domain-containing protein n=1 Tax=Terrihalobacillus insolitus TaxID=2950438 RepID=UPI00234275A5|nr:DUF418 domain-containing protein [Terrihalobacillus insolitus]MDC3413725.1 DUF418 domain-containing protein [Terrihalobacillus insolitus]
MNETGTPVFEHQRLEWIDAARGFAILGIFMVNVPAFNAPFFLYGGEDVYWSSTLDHLIQSLIDIFFQASFYTLFSFLFGFGTQIFVERLAQKGLHAPRLLSRRLVILIGFGLIHAFILWHGDILLSYGLIGLLLLLFLRRKDKTLVLWGINLLFISTGLITWNLYSIRERLGNFQDRNRIEEAFNNYGSGSLLDIWSQNYSDWIYVNGGSGYVFLTASLLPLFLFGMYVARKRWLHQVQDHWQFLKGSWVVLLLVFVVMKMGPYVFDNPRWFAYAQDNIGGSASALFYIVTITLLFHKERFKRLLKPLTYVGRMSLSNYVLQSIVSFGLFYSIGFGLYGSIPPMKGVIFVLFFYSMQVIWSRWWLKGHQFGPLEWVWRSLTYDRKQPWQKVIKQQEDSHAST